MGADNVGEPLGKPVIPWETRWARIEDLRIDKEYQRDEESVIVQRLTERFNHDIAGPLRVSERADGSLWVMDGQHRLQAMRARGDALAYCYVERGDQLSEARGYVELNGGTKVQALRRFKAALIAGDDPDVIAVNTIIMDSGFVIVYEGYGDDPRTFRAVTTALNIYRVRSIDGTPGRDRLRRVLSLARETWPDTVGAGQSAIVKALDSLFLNERIAALKRSRFAQRVGRLDPGEVAITAHQRSRAHGYATEQWALKDMVEAYNKDLRDPSRRLTTPIPTYDLSDEFDALGLVSMGTTSEDEDRGVTV